jgi:N-methylhydantoinase A
MSSWDASTPTIPIGGKLDRLDVEAAARAIDTHVGAKLGLSNTEPPLRRS